MSRKTKKVFASSTAMIRFVLPFFSYEYKIRVDPIIRMVVMEPVISPLTVPI